MTDGLLALIDLPRRLRPEDECWLPRLVARILPMALPLPAPPSPGAVSAPPPRPDLER